jgi:uncharacterized protein (TIGR02996 family)
MARIEDSYPWNERVREIIRQPDDDELRLRFAGDWERQGFDRERALLVRLQIKLGTMPGGVDHPEWFRLSSDAHDLIRNKCQEWVPEWYGEHGIQNPEFHRGFIDFVTVDARTLRTESLRRKLLDSAPIRHLNIVDLAGDDELGMILDSLARDGEAWRILSLNLDGQNLTDRGVLMLPNSSLSNIKWLSLAYNHVGRAGVEALAEASYGRLKMLGYVNLQGNPFDPVEEIYEDQGIVVARRTPVPPKPSTKWLERRVAFGRVIESNRFEEASHSAPAPLAAAVQ